MVANVTLAEHELFSLRETVFDEQLILVWKYQIRKFHLSDPPFEISDLENKGGQTIIWPIFEFFSNGLPLITAKIPYFFRACGAFCP